MRLAATAFVLGFAVALFPSALRMPPSAQALSCNPSAGPPAPAHVFGATLTSDVSSLEAGGSLDLRGTYSYAICGGTPPRVVLESRTDGSDFAPDAGAALYLRGTAVHCNGNACMAEWGTEYVNYVAAPDVTSDYRLRVGPVVSGSVTVEVDPGVPQTSCSRLRPDQDPPEHPLRLELTPERTRIVYGETVRLRGLFGFESCSGLLRPSARPLLESRRVGTPFPVRPADGVVSEAGDLVYEVAPPVNIAYRLYVFGYFGTFAGIEVAPRLALEAKARAKGVLVRVRASAGRSFEGARVFVEQRRGERWIRLRTLRLGPDSAATAVVEVEDRARLRARMPAPGSDYVGAFSQVVSVERA